jgi:hypothetical protein
MSTLEIRGDEPEGSLQEWFLKREPAFVEPVVCGSVETYIYALQQSQGEGEDYRDAQVAKKQGRLSGESCAGGLPPAASEPSLRRNLATASAPVTMRAVILGLIDQRTISRMTASSVISNYRQPSPRGCK